MSDRISTITAILIIIFIAMVLFSGVFGYWKYMDLKTRVVSPEVRNNIIANNRELSAEDAIGLVRNLPEVKNWLALFDQPNSVSSKGGRPVIEVDHQDSVNYIVHVYEIIADHTATHNWYDVNKVTGEVKSQF